MISTSCCGAEAYTFASFAGGGVGSAFGRVASLTVEEHCSFSEVDLFWAFLGTAFDGAAALTQSIIQAVHRNVTRDESSWQYIASNPRRARQTVVQPLVAAQKARVTSAKLTAT